MPPKSIADLVRASSLLSICDIGASYLRKPEYDGLIQNGLARIIGFEPNTEECEKLRGIYPEPHHFYPAFVGKGGPATFYETNWFPTGSLLKGDEEVLKRYTGLWNVTMPIAEHAVTTVALDELMPDQTIDFMKIDVQGAELDVFQGAEKLLGNVLAIHAEVCFVAFYEKQPLFSDVDQYLRKMGFGLVKFLGPRACTLSPVILDNNPNQGHQLMWSDALYMRNPFSLQNYSSDQLIKLATLSHDVYGMPDFAYRFLAELDQRNGTQLGTEFMS
jgi:FkbM family methyltransferase